MSEQTAWVYYIHMLPVFSHAAGETNSFRYILATLLHNGTCRQCELVKALGVDRKRLVRAQKQLEERGAESFFLPRGGRKGSKKLTEEKLVKQECG